MASSLFCRESGCWNCTEHPWSTQRGLFLKWSSFICCHVKSILCDWCERSDKVEWPPMLVDGGWVHDSLKEWICFGLPSLKWSMIQVFFNFSVFFHWFQLTGRELRKESAISRLHPSWRDGSSIQIYHDTSRNSLDKAVWHLPVCCPHRVDSWHLCLWIRGSCEVSLKVGKFHTFCE